jgi:2-isopropylmalate synthase
MSKRVAFLDLEHPSPTFITPKTMNSSPASDKILIFDTTLRDGEQSPGAKLNVEEKLRIAKQLAKLKVDIIEAGFPFSSKGDFEAVKKIADYFGDIGDPKICGLARATKKDIEAAAEALEGAAHKRIHTFLATSDIHMKFKLKKTRSEVISITGEMVAHARHLVDDVEFSPEDACRSEPDFLYQVLEEAIKAGATTVNIPDTVGYITPAEYGALIKGIKENVSNIGQAVISVHGHNDLGLAVANFLEAVKNGARQLECTINGIGERAGNAALEELVMALHVRRQYFNPFLGRAADSLESLTNVELSQIRKTSQLVSACTGMGVQRNKAIVGANAFAHESGIHQDGVLKNRLTYEIMDAQSIGVIDKTEMGAVDSSIVLGKLSGRNAFRTRLQDLGFELSEDDLNRSFLNFKNLADKKKTITDRDLEAIVDDVTNSVYELFKLVHIQYSSAVQILNSAGSGFTPNAVVTIQKEGQKDFIQTMATGDGPINAIYKAIQKATQIEESTLSLKEFNILAIGEGEEAQGEAHILLEYAGRKYRGHGLDTDIVIAGTRAYLNAINRIHMTLNKTEEEPELMSGRL